MDVSRHDGINNASAVPSVVDSIIPMDTRPLFVEPLNPTGNGNSERIDIPSGGEPTGEEVSVDIFEGEDFEELAQNVRESLFTMLDSVGKLERFAKGYWNSKESKAFFITRQLEMIDEDSRIVCENVKDMLAVAKVELGEEDENVRLRHADTSVLHTDFYFNSPDEETVDHYEHYQVV